MSFLGTDPVIYERSSDIREGSEYAVERECHGRVGSIVECVAMEL